MCMGSWEVESHAYTKLFSYYFVQFTFSLLIGLSGKRGFFFLSVFGRGGG